VSLSEDGYDVAIRGGDLTDATLIARQIGVIRAAAVASPGYLQRYGEPTSPHELKEHAVVGCISNGQQFFWPFDTPEGRLFHVASARVRTNDAASVRVGVKAGLGIGFGPSWLFEDELRSGDVIQILAEHSLTTFPIHAIRPIGRRPSSKVTAFIDFVAELFANEPHLSMPAAKRVRALA
jgi:LysR family transcriptional regulator for bpeEF and oprC